MRRAELITRALAEAKLWDLPAVYIDEIMEIAEKLRVPARMNVVKDFLAAYMVARNLMSKSTADRIIASNSKGRRFWEKKLRKILQ